MTAVGVGLIGVVSDTRAMAVAVTRRRWRGNTSGCERRSIFRMNSVHAIAVVMACGVVMFQTSIELCLTCTHTIRINRFAFGGRIGRCYAVDVMVSAAVSGSTVVVSATTACSLLFR